MSERYPSVCVCITVFIYLSIIAFLTIPLSLHLQFSSECDSINDPTCVAKSQAHVFNEAESEYETDHTTNTRSFMERDNGEMWGWCYS